MTAGQLYDWVLQATGSKDQAEEAHNERLKAQLRSGQKVDA